MQELPSIQSLWDYDDPAATEQRFRNVLSVAAARDRSYHAEIITQIARTRSLRGEFEEAHAVLDEVDSMITDEMPRARVRSLLERGRTFNSSSRKETAKELFVDAWERARRHGLDCLAVDAAHMCAIMEAGEEAFRWNETALALARSSSDPDARRWQGSLCNNLGWTCHAQGQYETALRYFKEALAHREEQGTPADIRIARWCIARCLRSLGRIQDALASQRALEAEPQPAQAKADGFIPEEIAECLHALGRTEEARPYFRRASALLSEVPWLVESEPERLARLEELGSSRGGDSSTTTP